LQYVPIETINAVGAQDSALLQATHGLGLFEFILRKQLHTLQKATRAENNINTLPGNKINKQKNKQKLKIIHFSHKN
jgi:hypothetical protein